MNDEEAGGDLEAAEVSHALGADQTSLAAILKSVLRDERLRELDGMWLDIHTDALDLREPLGQLNDRPSGPGISRV